MAAERFDFRELEKNEPGDAQALRTAYQILWRILVRRDVYHTSDINAALDAYRGIGYLMQPPERQIMTVEKEPYERAEIESH